MASYRNSITGTQLAAAGADADGAAIPLVALGAGTSGGATTHRGGTAATTNATSVKAAAGTVYGVQAINLNTSALPRYLKLYNKASAPTVGTDVPVKTLLIPGGTNGGELIVSWPAGLAFAVGIAYAVTTAIGDADTGAVTANEVMVNLDYK